jgi:hypothetical protein
MEVWKGIKGWPAKNLACKEGSNSRYNYWQRCLENPSGKHDPKPFEKMTILNIFTFWYTRGYDQLVLQITLNERQCHRFEMKYEWSRIIITVTSELNINKGQKVLYYTKCKISFLEVITPTFPPFVEFWQPHPSICPSPSLPKWSLQATEILTA